MSLVNIKTYQKELCLCWRESLINVLLKNQNQNQKIVKLAVLVIDLARARLFSKRINPNKTKLLTQLKFLKLSLRN